MCAVPSTRNDSSASLSPGQSKDHTNAISSALSYLGGKDRWIVIADRVQSCQTNGLQLILSLHVT